MTKPFSVSEYFFTKTTHRRTGSPRIRLEYIWRKNFKTNLHFEVLDTRFASVRPETEIWNGRENWQILEGFDRCSVSSVPDLALANRVFNIQNGRHKTSSYSKRMWRLPVLLCLSAKTACSEECSEEARRLYPRSPLPPLPSRFTLLSPSGLRV